ncbi:MAG: hypothetical protein PCFJNLEI_01210 [Verrucomicrobiae bacterium]|nr:hypothetical protein [Verrucomicrobiae bacterium]
MKRLRTLFVVVMIANGTAFAIDHSNLDEGRPLRVEDAYPIAEGEWALETGTGIVVPRQGSTRAVFPISVLYGALPNFHVGLGSILSTDPREIGDQTKSGDLQLSGLYNFNQETLTLPAFGLKSTVNFPSGVDSAGVDAEIKALVTKSFGNLSLHGNAGYRFLSGTRSGEREGRYQLILGASYPVGAPKYTRTTLVADVFTEQSARTGAANVFGAEIGFRHQLTHRTVADAGVGSEFAGPGDRSLFFFTTGVSIGF